VPLRTMTAIDQDDSNKVKVGSSNTGRIAIAERSNKRQVRPLMDHFMWFLEEACPNHAYPIRDKLKDCDMMKCFMIWGSPTWGMELNEDPAGSNTIPFPGEDVVMAVYAGSPPPRRHHMSNLSPRAPTHCGWGHGSTGV
jgi:hypothetical protein